MFGLVVGVGLHLTQNYWYISQALICLPPPPRKGWTLIDPTLDSQSIELMNDPNHQPHRYTQIEWHRPPLQYTVWVKHTTSLSETYHLIEWNIPPHWVKHTTSLSETCHLIEWNVPPLRCTLYPDWVADLHFNVGPISLGETYRLAISSMRTWWNSQLKMPNLMMTHDNISEAKIIPFYQWSSYSTGKGIFDKPGDVVINSYPAVKDVTTCSRNSKLNIPIWTYLWFYAIVLGWTFPFIAFYGEQGGAVDLSYLPPPHKQQGGAADLTTPGPHKHQGGTGGLCYPGPPQTPRRCCRPMLPRAPTNTKEVLGTYATPGPHKHQGGAADLCYPGPPQTPRGCCRPMLPRAPTNTKEVLQTYATPGPHKHQGGAADLCYPGPPQTPRRYWGPNYPGPPQTPRGCCRPMLPRAPTNTKGVLQTYATPGPHKHQGGAADLCYPGPPQTPRGCCRPMLPRAPTNTKEVLGTYATPDPHKHQGGTGDLCYPGPPQTPRRYWGPMLPRAPTNTKEVLQT